MSLSVPQNGVKADNEPVIELFVKVRPRYEPHGRSFSLCESHTPVYCDDEGFVDAVCAIVSTNAKGFFCLFVLCLRPSEIAFAHEGFYI